YVIIQSRLRAVTLGSKAIGGALEHPSLGLRKSRGSVRRDLRGDGFLDHLGIPVSDRLPPLQNRFRRAANTQLWDRDMRFRLRCCARSSPPGNRYPCSPAAASFRWHWISW